MVDRRNATRRALNDIVHRLLVAAGHVAPTGIRTRDGRDLTVGDKVIAKQPRRDLHVTAEPDRYVRNGARGTITATHHDRQTVTVDFDGVGSIKLPASFVDGEDRRPGLEHAYAVTSYAVQGATYPRSTSIVTPSSSQAELYVDITRGRTDNTVIAVHPPVERDDEVHLPRLPPPPTSEVIASSVGSKRGERCAIDLDPTALLLGRGLIERKRGPEARGGELPASASTLPSDTPGWAERGRLARLNRRPGVSEDPPAISP